MPDKMRIVFLSVILSGAEEPHFLFELQKRTIRDLTRALLRRSPVSPNGQCSPFGGVPARRILDFARNDKSGSGTPPGRMPDRMRMRLALRFQISDRTRVHFAVTPPGRHLQMTKHQPSSRRGGTAARQANDECRNQARMFMRKGDRAVASARFDIRHFVTSCWQSFASTFR